MRRRNFTIAATALVSSTVLLRSGDGNGASVVFVAPVLPSTGAAMALPAMGTNLSGLEWAQPGLRDSQSTAPTINFTAPRSQDVAYLASCCYTKNRLPIQWELLQPMLHDTVANASVTKAIGQPGAFDASYESLITGVLDAHAAAGITCIIDLHNYGRYQDFKYQADGAVVGLSVPADPLVRPYTTNKSQVQTRIFSLASGASLKPSNFTDFWTRAALKWKTHPGLGGYGLMNEPHDLPSAGGLVETHNGNSSAGEEDLNIWPTYAQAAILAIRAVDAATPIYVASNQWSSAMAIATKNPGFPLLGANLVYEVHMYLDASSSGAFFDYDTEVAKNYSAGLRHRSIQLTTGVDRLKGAIDWAKEQGVRLALTEVGMPVDDPRWERMFVLAITYALRSGLEVHSWMGGSHWPIRSFPINHVPGWHQNKTLPSTVSGAMLAAAGRVQYTLFDDSPGYAPGGTPLTVTVYARGNLAVPLTLTVASDNGGTLNKTKQLTQLIIPPGPNGQTTFTYTPEVNRITTLTYSSSEQFPKLSLPPRKIFSLTHPVAHAAVNLADAAQAIIAKYSACKWEMADGYTDYMLGHPSQAGEPIRAVSDSGYGSSPGNAMEMINAANTDNRAMGTMSVPVMRVTNGKKNSDHRVHETYGFWCKKRGPWPGIQAAPISRVPYNVEDAHFVLAAVSVPRQNNSGVVFQTSKAEEAYLSELGFAEGHPQARWLDAKGQNVQLLGPAKLAPNTPAVLTLTSAPGRQTLRVNGTEVATTNASFSASACTQMLIGWGFVNYYPVTGFGGSVYAVITGKGTPTSEELAVMEQFLASTAT